MPLNIPSDGVLPVFGSCFGSGECTLLRSIVVTDKTSGRAVAGHVEIVKSNSFEGWGYFVPDEPLQVGASLVVKPSGNYPVAQATVTVTTASALDASAVAVATSLTRDRTVLASTCCPTINPNVKPRCLDTSVKNTAVLAAKLSAVKPVATQYLYEVRLFAAADPAGGTVFDFAPLRTDARAPASSATFGVADSYCYKVSAKPWVGGEPVTLIETCLDNDLTDLGRIDKTPNEIASWSATCQVGPVPVDGGTPFDGDAGGRDEEPSAVGREAGCQLAAQSGPGAWWYALSLVLAARVRRRRGT